MGKKKKSSDEKSLAKILLITAILEVVRIVVEIIKDPDH